jgi:hypothetical protein
MYQAIEQHAAQFSNLGNLLRGPDAERHALELRRALEEGANEVNSQVAVSSEDREVRARIYRGLIAASRIVAQLNEAASDR